MAFYVHLLSGRFNIKAGKKASDAAQGKARAGLAQAWCDKYLWPRTMRFAYSTHEGVMHSHRLAREFCRRAEHYYNLWLLAPDRDSFEYSDLEKTSCDDDLEFVDFLLSYDVNHVTHIRGQYVRRLEPINPSEQDGLDADDFVEDEDD